MIFTAILPNDMNRPRDGEFRGSAVFSFFYPSTKNGRAEGDFLVQRGFLT